MATSAALGVFCFTRFDVKIKQLCDNMYFAGLFKQTGLYRTKKMVNSPCVGDRAYMQDSCNPHMILLFHQN